MGKIDAYLLSEKDLRAWLTRFGRGYSSSDHELAVAIHMLRIFEREFGHECCIGLELKSPLYKFERKPGMTDLEWVDYIIRNKVLQDSPIDFLIIKGNAKNPESEGYAFQLKRFGIKITEGIQDKLENYLVHDLPRNLGDCGEVGLVVVIDLDDKLNAQELKILQKKLDLKGFSERLNMKKYPYRKIFLLGITLEGIMHLTEIWPKFHQLTYKTY